MRSPAIRRSMSRASRIITSPTPHPYLDSSTCRCSSCHLKSAIFPRRTDGKIVLPRPRRPPKQDGSGRNLKNRKRHRPLDLDHDDGDGDARGKGKNRAVIGDDSLGHMHPHGFFGGGYHLPFHSTERMPPSTDMRLPDIKLSSTSPQTTLPHFSELRSGSDVRIPPANPDQWPRFPKIPAPSKHADRSKSHFEVLDFRNTSKDETSKSPPIDSWISWLPGSDEAGGPSKTRGRRSRSTSVSSRKAEGSQAAWNAPKKARPSSEKDSSRSRKSSSAEPPPGSGELQHQFIRFGVHTENPQPSIPPQTNYEETNGDNPSNHAVPDAGAQGSVLQTRMRLNPIRFREPLTAASRSDRRVYRGGVAIVQVKWDSDRKRRQGYFAPDSNGAEKSPFRHYSKEDCCFSD